MTQVMFAALVLQMVDFLKELTAIRTKAKAVLTQAAAFAGGILAVALGAHAGVADHLTLGLGQQLGQLDGASQVLVGLLVASAGSTLVDFKQALDGTDSAAKPPLGG